MTEAGTTTPLSQSLHRTSGRRQRGESALSAPCHASTVEKSRTLADAKAKFAASVSRGISVLVKECGYSRARAAATLLREISRGDHSPPGDDEIFQAMSSHGLGIEDAARALTVSKALQQKISQRNVSILEAIDDLTATLSVTNLVHRGSRSPTTAAITSDDLPPRTATEIRIQPVPTLNVSRPSSSPASIDGSPTAGTNGRKAKPANKNAKQKNSNGNRKRPAEDISESNRPDPSLPGKKGAAEGDLQVRPRSDSLSEVVSAKFGEESSSTTRTGALTSPAPVRVKRGRVEHDGESTHNALKRSRTNSD